MIDFIKIEVKEYNYDTVFYSEYLDFTSFLNRKTGEFSKYMFANLNGLKFKLFDSTEANLRQRLTIEGSLHKFFNDGKHNFNDFCCSDAYLVLQFLFDEFNIYPEHCVIKQIEFGLNIEPPVDSKEIIKFSLLHKTTMFKWVYVKDEGEYKQAMHQQYLVKIYNKKKHYEAKGYNINNEILRIELKFTRMAMFHKKNIFTIKDLFDYGLFNLVHGLIYAWEDVLFYDYLELDYTDKKDKYSNLNYWDSLKPENFKYHRNQMKQKVGTNPLHLKKRISIILLLKGLVVCPQYYLN